MKRAVSKTLSSENLILLSSKIQRNQWNASHGKELIDTCLSDIDQTRLKREDAWLSGKEKLIGVHTFLNNDESKAKSWGTLPNYLGKEYLTVERTH